MKSCLTRYLRLTPLLAVMVLFNGTLSVHMSKGPIWDRGPSLMFEYPCVKYWWSELLYIGNYFNPDLTCVGPSWYVNCDLQLYVLALLLLLPLYKWPSSGYLLVVTCFLSSVIGTCLNAYSKKLYSCYFYSQVALDRDTELSSGLDYKGFHFRAPSFLMGLVLGISIFKSQERSFKISKQATLLGWIVQTVGCYCLALVTGHIASPHHQYSPWLDPLYVSLSKPVSCACVAWVIYICTMGHGGFVNQFLSWSLFRPLSRLTFGVFLVHETVVAQQLFSIQAPIAFTFTEYFFLSCGDVILSFMLATVTYLTIEAPCNRLVVLFLKRKMKSENASMNYDIQGWKSDGVVKK